MYAKAGEPIVEGRYEIPVTTESIMETAHILFQEGYQEFLQETISWTMFRTSPAYRGGWLAAATSSHIESQGRTT